MSSVKVLKEISKKIKTPFETEDSCLTIIKPIIDIQISSGYKKYKSSDNIYEELKFRWVLAILLSWKEEDDHGHWHYISHLYEKNAVSIGNIEKLFKDVTITVMGIISCIKLLLEAKVEFLQEESIIAFQKGSTYQGIFIQKDVAKIKKYIEKIHQKKE